MEKKLKWREPELGDDLRQVEDIFTTDVVDEVYEVIIRDVKKELDDFFGYTFSKVHFLNCKFDSVSFERCSFEDVIFENCSFRQCNFRKTDFQVVTHINSLHRHTDFSESGFYCVGFEKCNMRYSNFTNAKVKGFQVFQSDFNSTFFGNCTLESVLLQKSSFCQADFFQTPLKDIDFSDSNIEGIIVSDNGKELKGMLVNSMQAVDLSRMLGIIVK